MRAHCPPGTHTSWSARLPLMWADVAEPQVGGPGGVSKPRRPAALAVMERLPRAAAIDDTPDHSEEVTTW